MNGHDLDLIKLVEDLTGQKAPLTSTGPEKVIELFQQDHEGIGYSQFNELLLWMGYDRVTHAFFQYLANGSTDYKPGSALSSLEQLRQGVERFRKLALLLFGNVKFAFKQLSRDAEQLNGWLWFLNPRKDSEFSNRHKPVQSIEKISGEETYFLGYIVQRDVEQRLKESPEDPEALKASERRSRIVEIGERNHEAYLTSDHLDVYVATSMRARHEYLLVHELTEEIFRHPKLQPLKLRWFDPTQAYCPERIDKGLSEALMLKRAKCTVYFVQETDTLGKDSELASTLAQGKPVIAFVPQLEPNYVQDLVSKLQSLYPGKEEKSILLEQLRIFEPGAAWDDPMVRTWLNTPESFDIEKARERLASSISKHYDRRAKTLKEDHPLGIQVNLETGVANGVLVVRSVDSCSELIHRVITKNLEFKLEVKTIKDCEYLLLKETISDCVYRVMTGDSMLTNAFWNFYLEPSE